MQPRLASTLRSLLQSSKCCKYRHMLNKPEATSLFFFNKGKAQICERNSSSCKCKTQKSINKTKTHLKRVPLRQTLQVLFRKHTKSFPSWLLTPTVYYSILLTNAHNDDCYHLVSNVGSQGIANISIYLSRSSEASYPSEESHCLNLEVTHVCTELFSYKALLLLSAWLAS